MSARSAAELKHLQDEFFAHLMGEESNVSQHILSTPDRSATQRLHIYASGYRLRLKEAITTDFTCLGRYLGDELFEQMMDNYIDRYRSEHPSLRFYSQHIIQLLTQTAPFSAYPELLEIAQIEQTFNDSFDAANGDTIGVEGLVTITPEQWETLSIRFHPSLRILNLKTNSFLIWKSLSEEQVPPKLLHEDSSWIIWRKDLVSRFQALGEDEACVLSLALQGENFAHMCEALTEFHQPEQAPLKMVTFLQQWMNEKMVCQLV